MVCVRERNYISPEGYLPDGEMWFSFEDLLVQCPFGSGLDLPRGSDTPAVKATAHNSRDCTVRAGERVPPLLLMYATAVVFSILK